MESLPHNTHTLTLIALSETLETKMDSKDYLKIIRTVKWKKGRSWTL